MVHWATCSGWDRIDVKVMEESLNNGSLGMWPGVVLEDRCLLLGVMTTHALRKNSCETHQLEAWKVLGGQESSLDSMTR